MLTLLIDSSTERGLLALAQDGVCLAKIPLQMAEGIFPALPDFLQEAGYTSADLNALIVGVGPGSYTGIRLAVVVAKSLAYVHRIPLIGVSTLFGFVPDGPGAFAAVIDARIGGIYTLIGYRSPEGEIHYASTPTLYPLAQAKEQLQLVSTLVSPHVGQVRARLEDTPHPAWHWQEKGIDAKQMLDRGHAELQAGRASHEAEVTILYLRATQAELEREGSSSR